MLNSISVRAAIPSGRPRQSKSTEATPTKASEIFTRSVASPNFLSSALTKVLKGSRWVELQRIKRVQEAAAKLTKPSDFQKATQDLKDRLEAGEGFEDIRAQAYAVAARACEVALKMKPYDCQLLGALSLGSGEIAEMMTGEGKTLTAVMPLYLHALAGKGSQLVTVNDTLAQRDAQEMGPAFRLLGLTVGTVLEGMTAQEKREGYAADVTYTTDRTLGFDYLRDRTAMKVEDRVQRPPFFALVDEVDEVLLDEARTPLIISGQGETPSEDYHKFDDILEKLKPGIDYFVNREQGTAWLSDLGTEFVENELYGDSLSYKDAQSVAQYHRKAGALRAEGKAFRSLLEHQGVRPGFFNGFVSDEWADKRDALRAAYEEAASKTDAFPDNYNLYSAEHQHQVRYLQASLKAHALFEEGVDYIVQDQKVKIVDENKGRTSEGRRFNEGLHQALEARSGVPLRPESRPISSITYPNLFKKYPHLAGMSGTAKSSEAEFHKLYDLKVTKVPTNLQFKTNPESPEKAPRHARVDEPDAIFRSKKEKFAAVVAEAMKAYQEGVPVLVGTLSVEANEYLHSQLLAQGVNPAALQVLNAEHVRGDKSLENEIISQAGRSGMITVATNMAGRGVNIKPDFTNYKKLAMEVERLADKALVVDLNSKEEAQRLGQWLEGRFPYRIGEGAPKAGETVLRVASEAPLPSGVESLNSDDFRTGGLYVLGTERAKSRRIDDQLIGRAGRQGKVGRSKFFLSLEDDLVRALAEKELDGGLKTLAGGASELGQELVAKAQHRLAEMDLYSREQTGLYDKTLNTQRESFYDMRDAILEPEADLRYKMVGDTQDYLREKLTEVLGSGKHEPLAVKREFAKLSSELKMPLVWNHREAEKLERVLDSVDNQVEHRLESAFESFDQSGAALDETYRGVLLHHCDRAWSSHLESMGNLRQSVQWVTTVGEKPEDAFNRRGYDQFAHTLNSIRDASVLENIPQILVGAKILERDRQLAS